jgi:hypothetical protein
LNGVESYLRGQVVSPILDGEFGPVARRAGPGHLFGDVDLVEEALCHDAVSAGRSGPPVADGAFTHLQAMDRLALDHARLHAGGLSVTSLPAFGCVDSADPHAYLGAIGFHGEGVAVRHG